MTHGLRRGSTVAYGPHYGVVWAVETAPLQAEPLVRLFPVIASPRRLLAGDLALDLAELVAAGLALPQAVVRLSSPRVRSISAVRLLGELRERTVCHFVAGVIRAHEDARVRAKYEAHDRHRRDNAERRPVKMHD